MEKKVLQGKFSCQRQLRRLIMVIVIGAKEATSRPVFLFWIPDKTRGKQHVGGWRRFGCTSGWKEYEREARQVRSKKGTKGANVERNENRKALGSKSQTFRFSVDWRTNERTRESPTTHAYLILLILAHSSHLLSPWFCLSRRFIQKNQVLATSSFFFLFCVNYVLFFLFFLIAIPLLT